MHLRAKITLKRELSRDTLEAVRTYLDEFVGGRHTIEHFDGTVALYFYDRADAEFVRKNFPFVVARVQPLY